MKPGESGAPEALARAYVSALPGERAQWLREHRPDLAFAQRVKDVCFEAWHSDPGTAVQAAEGLRELALFVDVAEVRALAEWTTGIADMTRGEMASALAHLRSASEAFLALGKTHLSAETGVSEVVALAMLGRYDEAVTRALEARAVFLDHRDLRAAGKIEQNLGNLFFRRDRYVEAAAYFRTARERFEAIGDAELLVAADKGLADTLAWQHRFDEAAALYEETLARSTDWPLLAAQIEGELGLLDLAQARYESALKRLESSRRRLQVIGATLRLAYAEQRLADAYLELNFLDEAIVLYDRAIALFTRLDLGADLAWATAKRGRALGLGGQHREAAAAMAAAREHYAREGNEVGAAWLMLWEAELALLEADTRRAARLACESRRGLEAAGADGGVLLTLWVEAEAERREGREARPRLATALKSAQARRLPYLERRCWTSMGLEAVAQGDLKLARHAFIEAILILEAQRADLPGEEWRAVFVSDKLQPYAELARIALASGDEEAAFETVERGRARALLDRMGMPRDVARSGERDALRVRLDWCYRQMNRPFAAPSPALRDEARRLEAEWGERQRLEPEILRSQWVPLPHRRLRSALGATAALVEYFVLDGALWAFVVTGEAVRAVDLGVREEAVEAHVARLRYQTDTLRHGAARLAAHLPQLEERTRRHLAALYDALLRPLERLVAGRRLVIVPHRSLHYVPFSALHDGERHVADRHDVSLAPSAAIWLKCTDLHLERSVVRPPDQWHAALFGTSDPRLPHAAAEATNLAPLFAGADVRIGEEASVSELRRLAASADVLHLACHGEYRADNPLFSAMHLADGALTVRDAYGLKLRASLVTLSACDTGVHAVMPGDELLGLARGFFAAGATSMLVSLWAVDDETTERFMRDFYGRLLAGVRPGSALRAAQCAAREASPHPYFWSPFVLIGRA